MTTFDAVDKKYISRCLQLARCGAGSTSPNPMVGAVIVCDGRVIGEGYHIRAARFAFVSQAKLFLLRCIVPSNCS